MSPKGTPQNNNPFLVHEHSNLLRSPEFDIVFVSSMKSCILRSLYLAKFDLRSPVSRRPSFQWSYIPRGDGKGEVSLKVKNSEAPYMADGFMACKGGGGPSGSLVVCRRPHVSSGHRAFCGFLSILLVLTGSCHSCLFHRGSLIHQHR